MSKQQPDPTLKSIADLQATINELYGAENLPPPCQNLHSACDGPRQMKWVLTQSS